MKLTYRPEIDGLRAIAVGAVILYHAQITILGYQPFKGGFIGVDIFFVISGYLITSIILKELVTTGAFSFKHFYERRVRRILPALLFVMLVSLPFAWMYLLPSSFIDFSKSILYSLGFSSNFYFHYSGQEYGAESGLLKPFLHTWSLSIEEQFYILFPIVLLVTFKYFRNYLIHILILGLVISLGLAEWTSRNYPSTSFYFLHTRMWELLAGSILAYFEITNGKRSENKTLNLILPGTGLFLIGHSILLFNDKMFHPSFYTLSPIIGVCLIIWFSNKNELITKILSTKLFVGIGLISYSLYLLHYPIFAFSRITSFTDANIFKKLILVGVVFILSIFSYFFIEKLARLKLKLNNFLTIILITIFFLIFNNISILITNGYEKRFYKNNDFLLQRVGTGSFDHDYVGFETNYDYDSYDRRKNILIVGNSHGEDILKILSYTNLRDKFYFNITSPIKREKDYNFQVSYFYDFLTKGEANLDTRGNYNKADFINHLKKQYLLSDLIILATNYSPKDIEILDDLIKIIKQDKKKIIIFDNSIIQKKQSGINSNKLMDYIVINKKFPNIEDLDIIEKQLFNDKKYVYEINDKIKKIAEINEVFLFERLNLYCDTIKKKCPVVTDRFYKIYLDSSHITKKGAEFFSKKIVKNEMFMKYLNSTLHISSN